MKGWLGETRRSRSGVGRLSGVGALVAVLLVAAPGLGSRLETRERSVTIPEAEFGETTSGHVAVKCGRGDRFISGGFDNPEFREDSFILPYSARMKRGRKWAVSALNIEAPAGTLTAYAYCRPGERLRVKSRSTQVQPFETSSVSAKCRRGQTAISGGFVNGSPDDPDIHPNTSRRKGGRGWTVAGPNLWNDPEGLTAEAYCVRDEPLATGRKRASLEGGEQRTLRARCERSERVVSGGFANPDAHVRVFESRKAGPRSWKVSGWASGAATLKAFAYCQRR